MSVRPLTDQGLAGLGVVESGSPEHKHVFLPAVPLAVPHVQLSLQLGEDLTLEQLLRWGGRGGGRGDNFGAVFCANVFGGRAKRLN